MHHPTDRIAHTTAFCYTSCGALAGTRNSCNKTQSTFWPPSRQFKRIKLIYFKAKYHFVWSDCLENVRSLHLDVFKLACVVRCHPLWSDYTKFQFHFVLCWSVSFIGPLCCQVLVSLRSLLTQLHLHWLQCTFRHNTRYTMASLFASL